MKKVYKSRFIDTKNNNQSIIGKKVCIILMVKQIGDWSWQKHQFKYMFKVREYQGSSIFVKFYLNSIHKLNEEYIYLTLVLIK